ncbi:hypothetical protein ACL03H_03890 [Saccharopolyspora sp. MS10]|uniref:hypothetical protein n=1 Tax=Saccharopolyspora sp. MS10 TaxID=3385973 RepID=UPI0039A1B19A
MRVPRERDAPREARPVRALPGERRQEPGSAPPRSGMSPTEVLRLQRSAGNRAVSGSLQRAQEERESSAAAGHLRQPRGGLRSLVPGWAEALPVKRKLTDRLVKGPVFSADEIAELKRQDPKWLRAIGTGRYEDAAAYVARGKYYDWLRLEPGKRLLIATLEWRERLGDQDNSPAFTLGRHLDLRGGALTGEERAAALEQRDTRIREAFVNTLASDSAGDVHDEDAVIKNNRANLILTNVFLILQNGLQVYDEQANKHVDHTTGDVNRALAHGGRVNIRIPALGEGESATALTDWLGVTENGVNERDEDENGEKLEKRGFATHHMSIRGTEKFEERGGMIASARNVLDRRVRLWGLPLAADGMGRHDFNGDVILPDNSHGHMLLVFTPPRRDRDGALEVGLETIGPGGASPVGHEHNWLSTEATANPESSFYGHKKDKVGGGELKDNQRYVPMAELGSGEGWLAFLRAVKSDWEDRLTEAGDDLAARQALYRQLVGKREGGFTPRPAPGT